MTRLYSTRFLLTAAILAWGLALAAQPRAGAPDAYTACNTHIDNGRPQGSPLRASVDLQLAGFNRPDAAPGQRIFFTVREDVRQNGDLYIAAGARAKGTIRAIHRSGTILLLVIEPETVQTVYGPLVALVSELVTLELDLSDPGARYCPFSTGLAPVL